MTTSQSEYFDIDREQSIERNVDAFGRQWKIGHLRGSNLYAVKSEQLKTNANIPEEIGGKWTKVPLLEARIKQYVTSTWDKADEEKKKARGKARAKKQLAEEKKEESASSASNEAVSSA